MKTFLKALMVIVSLSSTGHAGSTEKDGKAEFIEALKGFKKAWAAEDREAAFDFAERAYDLSQELYGEGTKYQYFATKQFAMAQDRHGHRDEAIKFYLEALEDGEQIYDVNGPELFDIYFALSALYSSSHEHASAEKYLSRAEKVYEESFPDDLLVKADILNLRAKAYFYEGKAKAAEKNYLQVHDIYEKEYGKDHPQTYMPYFFLAKIHMARKDYDKARELLEPANEVFRKTLPPRNTVLMASHAFLVEIYEKLEQPDKATEHCVAIAEAKPNDTVDSYKPIFRGVPAYPVNMARSGREGYVILEFTIDEAGMVKDIRVLEGAKGFKKAAVESAKRWRFAPAIKDGKPVATHIVNHKITFELVR
ncbi:TonB family protein [Emcibacter nanhaiensis]|uniref:TonB family protein n=1 Tax=Emcibacter nanhaiensis TaxID=1505037 RepID=A0A501PQ50_9PROT|nr:TonB family protein [Emcibacter nanhaiensis]TPD61906.1 TonB family protein [Emcibacter nanhaiensis]